MEDASVGITGFGFLVDQKAKFFLVTYWYYIMWSYWSWRVFLGGTGKWFTLGTQTLMMETLKTCSSIWTPTGVKTSCSSHLASQSFFEGIILSSPPHRFLNLLPTIPWRQMWESMDWVKRRDFGGFFEVDLTRVTNDLLGFKYNLVLILTSSSPLLLYGTLSPSFVYQQLGPQDSTLPCSYSSRISSLAPGLSSFSTLPLPASSVLFSLYPPWLDSLEPICL